MHRFYIYIKKNLHNFNSKFLFTNFFFIKNAIKIKKKMEIIVTGGFSHFIYTINVLINIKFCKTLLSRVF